MEIEVKIGVDDAESTAVRLGELGGREIGKRALEDNRLFDLGGLPLTASGRLLRVRTYDGRSVLTAKAPADDHEHAATYKVRREIETEVGDADDLTGILETLGYRAVWRYQKWRRTFEFDGVEAVVDELPFGSFVELEGEPEKIDALAVRLGHGPASYVTGSYRDLWEIECARRGVPVGDLVFADPPGDRA